MDAAPKTQSGIYRVYTAHIVAWFCFLYMIYTINPPKRSVSPLIFVGFVFAVIYVVIVGFVTRQKFFRESTDALPSDLHKALKLWRLAHLVGFTFAMSITIFAVALKLLGSSWLVAGIFFGLGLSFLLLWRPRHLAVSDAQPS